MRLFDKGGVPLPKILDRKAKTLLIIALSLIGADVFCYLLSIDEGIAALCVRSALRISAAIILSAALYGLWKRNADLKRAVTREEITRFYPIPILVAVRSAISLAASNAPFEMTAVIRLCFALSCTLCAAAAAVLAIIVLRSLRLRAMRMGAPGDELDVFLFSAAIALFAVSSILAAWFFFFPPSENEKVLTLVSAAVRLVDLAGLGLFVYSLFRSLSKNRFKRGEENNAYLSKKKRFCDFFTLQKNRIKERDTHVYKKCPNCKAVLRLPRKKGKHGVVCPRCQKRFDVKILWE